MTASTACPPGCPSHGPRSDTNLGPWLTRRLPQRTLVVSMMTVMVAGFALYVVAAVSAAGRPILAIGGSLATFVIGAAFPMLMDGVINAAPSVIDGVREGGHDPGPAP